MARRGPTLNCASPVEHVKGTAIKRAAKQQGVAGAHPIKVDGIYYEFVWPLRKTQVDC